MKKNKISIIVPCYNEAEALPTFYKELNHEFSNIDAELELIFVDDGSHDKTIELIKSYSLKDKRVNYISFSRNFGKEAAMYAGLEKASGDYIAIMDADMQDPPSMLSKMYEEIINNSYDVVALYSPEHEDYSFIRRFFTKRYYKFISKISNTEQIPGARDFRLMKRNVVDAILSMKEYNRYSKGIFSFVGFTTKWIKYKAPNRIAGKSKFSLFSLFKYGLEGVIAFSTKPLVVSAFIGILLCILSFLAILIIVIKTIVWGDPVAGWPSLACIIIFMTGLQLFFIGIIGLYLAKIYLEVKERPIYIVKETEKDLKR